MRQEVIENKVYVTIGTVGLIYLIACCKTGSISNIFEQNDFHPKQNVVNGQVNKIESSSTIVGISRNITKYTDNKLYNLEYTMGDYSSDDFKCDFNTKVENNKVYDNTVFRPISLTFPFPARDGKNRLPGLNWFDDENYVYEYITNNRNIQSGALSNEIRNPNMMYLEREPLYIVDLDASSMIKIREYNKNHTYDDIELECDGKNRACISVFLRNNSSDLKLDGTCQNGLRDLSNYYNALAGAGESYQTQIDFDIDGDGRHDSTDATKMSDFYACADKDEKSGGPF